MNASWTGSRASEARKLLGNARWALGIAWSTSAPLTLALVGVAIARSVVPAGLALVSRGLINTLASAVNSGNGAFDRVFPWMAMGLGLALVHVVSGLANRFVSQRLADDLYLRVTSDILSHAAELDVGLFEDRRFADVLERAQRSSGGHFFQFLTRSVTAVSTAIQGISLAGVMIAVDPLVALVLILCVPPYAFFQWRMARTRFSKEYTRATKRRWTRYFLSRLTGEQSAAEVRLLDLGPLFLDRFRALMGEYLPDVRPDYRDLFSAKHGGAFDLMHDIDLAIWYAGQRVRQVYSLNGTYSDIGIEAPDVVEILMGFKDRCLASVHLDFFQRPRRRQIELIGTDGVILVEFARWDRCTVRVYEAARGAWEQEELATDRDDMFRAEDREFLQAVAKDKPIACTVEEARRSVEVVLAAQQVK